MAAPLIHPQAPALTPAAAPFPSPTTQQIVSDSPNNAPVVFPLTAQKWQQPDSGIVSDTTSETSSIDDESYEETSSTDSTTTTVSESDSSDTSYS
jgi:hypothetical protein